MSKFGFLGKLEFLQNLASVFVSRIPGPVIHNIDKYFAIKKSMYLVALDGTDGDYLEFGVYTGSSFCHAIRCARSLLGIFPLFSRMKFYGFDVFGRGFDHLDKSESHEFYVSNNFEADYKKVSKRVARAAVKSQSYRLVKGLFEDTLKGDIRDLGVSKCSVMFIDSDTYSSACLALNYSKTSIQSGTIIILDDYFSYSGDPDQGVSKAFEEFKSQEGYLSRQIFSYGMGGVVHILKKVKK
jgi:O-methyltransferase